MFNWPLFIERTIHVSNIYEPINFLQLKSLFFANSELITNPITPLSNNASTITSSCISTLSSPIFTVTSFRRFPLSRLQQDVLSTILLSIANLLFLRSNWDLLDLCPHLNYFVCFFHAPFSSYYLFPNFYNSLPNVQTLYNYNSSFSPSCSLLWMHHYCLCSLYSLHWSRPCCRLLRKHFLPPLSYLLLFLLPRD